MVGDSLADVIAAGRQQWGHMNFYCARVDSLPEPRYALSDSQIVRRGERVLHQLKEEGKLDDIAGGSFIAIEPQQGRYVVGDSVHTVYTEGERDWNNRRFYIRPIDDRMIPCFR